jgi:hypothetical protein
VFVQLTPRQQGNLGEYSAVEWFMSKEMGPCVPIGHTSDYDLMAEVDGKAARIQVKTSGCFRNDRWELTVCTRGGNRSWGGMAKHLDPARFEYLFVLVADGRRWLIPSTALGGKTGLLVGGPKYAAFEIESGRPFQDRRCRNPASTIRAATA